MHACLTQRTRASMLQRMAPRTRRLSLAVAATLLALLAVELGYRGRLAWGGAAYGARAARAELADLEQWMSTQSLVAGPRVEGRTPQARGQKLHPYLGFDAPAERDALSAQLDYFAGAEADEAFDIVLLGGSVAAVLGAMAGARFVETLGADARFAGRRINFFPHACAGHKQPQALIRLGYLLCLGIRPDAVIELDGYNELAVPSLNAQLGAHPSFPSAPQWIPLLHDARLDLPMIDGLLAIRDAQLEAQAILERTLRYGLFHSAILGRASLGRLHDLRNEIQSVQSAVVDALSAGVGASLPPGPDFDPDPAALVEQSVRAWAEGSMSMHAMCASRGIHYLHVLQPALHDTGSKPATESELRNADRAATPAMIDAIARGYPRLRGAGARLLELGLAFHDGSRVFQDHPEELYSDACHLHEPGSELLIDAILEAFLDTLPPGPVRTATRR